MPPLPQKENTSNHQHLGDHDGPEYPSRLGDDVVVRLSFLWETEPVGTTPCTQGTREQTTRHTDKHIAGQSLCLHYHTYVRACSDAAARREDIQRPELRG